jgi:toxin-antitoxin system PIN domain toxin
VILPDVNVLLYAFRRDAPSHQACRRWLDSVVNADAPYGMSPQVLASVVRIATHPRIFATPSGREEAFSFAGDLLNQPHCQLIVPGTYHWDIFRDLCRKVRATGNLVQDAWFAALAIESGCEWITADRHYAVFEGLRWRAPV